MNAIHCSYCGYNSRQPIQVRLPNDEGEETVEYFCRRDCLEAWIGNQREAQHQNDLSYLAEVFGKAFQPAIDHWKTNKSTGQLLREMKA